MIILVVFSLLLSLQTCVIFFFFLFSFFMSSLWPPIVKEYIYIKRSFFFTTHSCKRKQESVYKTWNTELKTKVKMNCLIELPENIVDNRVC